MMFLSSTNLLLVASPLLVVGAAVTVLMRYRRDGAAASGLREAFMDPAARRWGLAVAVLLGIINVSGGSYVGGLLSAALLGGIVTLLAGRTART